MTKYFRIALTSALLGGLAMPAFAQTAPAAAPAATPAATPAPTVKKTKPAHKHHVATAHHVASKTTAPSK